LWLEALLVYEDGDEGVPYGLRGQGEEFGWGGERGVALAEEGELFFLGDDREGGGGDGGGEWGDVEYGADEGVDVADGADGGGFFVGEGEGEEVFGAEDDLYGV
jgi:hypothetical protein